MSVETFRTIAPRYVIAAVKEIWLGPGTMDALIRRSHGGSPVSSIRPTLLMVTFCGVESTHFANVASPSSVGG